MKIKLFLMFCLCAMFGCALAAGKHNFKDHITPTLSGGYSTDKQMSVGTMCLNGTSGIKGDTRKVSIQLGDSRQFDEIQKDLNVNISTSGSIGIFSWGASANYARHIKNDAYSEDFYYMEQIELPSKVFYPAGFGESALNDFGKAAYNADSGHNQFRISCGDKFVQEVPQGANLFVTLKLNFRTNIDKTNFDSTIKGGLGNIFNAITNLHYALSKKHVDGNLEISAYQEGGIPSRLTNIFGKDKDHYYVTICDFDHLDDCRKTIDKIIDYAKDDFAKQQIDYQKDGGKFIGNVAPLSYSKISYDTYGLKTGPSVVTPEINKDREKLADSYGQTLSNINLVTHLINSPASRWYSKNTQDKLTTLLNNLNKNTNILTDSNTGAINCYSDPTSCPMVYNDIIQRLKPADIKSLGPLLSGFRHEGEGYVGLDYPVGESLYASFGGNSNYQGLTTIIFDGKNIHTTGHTLYKDCHFDGVSIGNDMYQGNVCCGGNCHNYIYTVIDNPS